MAVGMGQGVGMTRVLVVEDEPAIADALVYALQTDRFEVSHALTGGDALAMLGAGEFDFVILDVGLPDMTGFDLCRKLRESSAVPVLFLTARDAEIDRILGLEIGGDDYVTKPFSPREVTARVRAILRRGGEVVNGRTAAVVKTTQALFHDAVAMRIHCHGVCLDLTAHEYKLLLVLLENQGRVFTRDQLLEKAWYDPGAVTDRTVDAHIKTVRAKMRMARAGAEELIQTRRGLGYVLVMDGGL
jgi:two-component system, OmpR family, catabolic regulation response regulator CreB